jgi:hypothetical protein
LYRQSYPDSVLCSGEIEFVNIVYFVGAEEKVEVKVVEEMREILLREEEREKEQCFVTWFTDVAHSFIEVAVACL